MLVPLSVCLFIIAQKGIAGKANTQIFLFPKKSYFRDEYAIVLR